MKNDQFDKMILNHYDKLIIVLFVDDECGYCISYMNLIKDIISTDDKYRRKVFLIHIDQYDEPFSMFEKEISNKVASLLFMRKKQILLKKIGVLNRNQFINALDRMIE